MAERLHIIKSGELYISTIYQEQRTHLNFVDVVNGVLNYAQLHGRRKLFASEPCLEGLSESEEDAIQGVKVLVKDLDECRAYMRKQERIRQRMAERTHP
ncbi:MAG: hypothetical protein CMH63_00145 [Nanoarchaeota archaeon]|jgi:hypothetical protein|nr:hypothetical protein [Nanoarchaeota archaeon]|tara:strand:- start:43507 stop:43803 length:297 start_codon:yes stop_codon:yes gene_type:complete